MIERFFRRPHVQRRLKEGPLAGVVHNYLRHLEDRGYATSTVHHYVQAAEHFGYWLKRARRAVTDGDVALVQEFLRRHLPRCHCRTLHSQNVHSVRAALHQLLASFGLARRPVRQERQSAVDAVVDDFDHHLADVCGAAVATRRYYLREVRAFLAEQFKEEPVDLASLSAESARAFVTKRAKSVTPASANVFATAIRSFGRYLQFRGIRAGNWTAAVPRAADWRLARLPRVLTDDEVETLLAAFDRTCAHGRRDYAIALCLLDLGLRASEVADIRLADVDWHSGILLLHTGKARRGSGLPLPARVARALADYLQHGRPKTSERALFVHQRPPRGRRIGPGVVRSAMRLAYARAGLDSRCTGTHVLRHTAATRLLRAGVPMKEIADLLRHRSLNTSAIYAKVDLSALTAVALPWPGVRS